MGIPEIAHAGALDVAQSIGTNPSGGTITSFQQVLIAALESKNQSIPYPR